MGRNHLTPRSRVVVWIAQVVAAAILAQTLFFKFTGAPEAVWLFTELGVEPYGRIGLGVVELVAVVALLVPRLAALGAALTVGLMVGALFTHLLIVGVVVQDDGGTLFALAITTLVASAIVLVVRRGELPLVGDRLARAV